MTGTIEWVRGGPVEFGQGTMNVGEPMAVPIIRQLKEWAIPPGVGNRPIILDAPPGTACPVVESMRDADFVLLVTEPTPFGLNDLKLAVGAVRTLEIPLGIIINRCDVGDDQVAKYAREEGIPILMEIPDDRGIAEAYSRGIMMVDVKPEMKDRFRALYERITELVG